MPAIIDENLIAILPFYLREIFHLIATQTKIQLTKGYFTTIKWICYWPNKQQLSNKIVNVIELNCTTEEFPEYQKSRQAQTHWTLLIEN